MSTISNYKAQKKRLRSSIKPSDAPVLPFAPTIEALEQWAQNLPVLNTSVMGENLHLAASAILNGNLSLDIKFSLTEKLIPKIDVYFDACLKDILDCKFPLQDKQNYQTEKLISTLMVFYNIYIDAIKSEGFSPYDSDETKNQLQLFTQHQQAIVIHRTLYLLAQIQLFSSVTYRTNTLYSWDEINALYSLAKFYELEIVDSGIHTVSTRATKCISDEYIKIIFIHLALLNRFRQRDILKIHQIVNEQANTVTITTEKTDNSALYCDLSSDLAASNINNLKAISKNPAFFDSEVLTQHFTSLALDKNANKTLLNPAVIQKLIPCWQKPHLRQFARTSAIKEITIYPGFKNIICKLSPNDTPEVSLGKNSAAKKASFGLSNVEIIPIDNDAQQQQFIRSEKDIARIIKSSDENTVKAEDIWSGNNSNTPKTSEHLDAIQKDASAAGFMFQIAQENKSILQAADLIGIDTSNNGNIELAIIRRLDNLECDGISLGVELIAPTIELGVICNTDKSIRSREVLFLPGIEKLHQPDAIICLAPIENTRINLELKVNTHIEHYVISKLVETNAVFTRYTLQKAIKEG